MKDSLFPDGPCVMSGMSFRGRTNESRLFVRCQSHEDECRTDIREWIASLANSAYCRLRLRAVASLRD